MPGWDDEIYVRKFDFCPTPLCMCVGKCIPLFIINEAQGSNYGLALFHSKKPPEGGFNNSIKDRNLYYSLITVTTPDPTVRPPSRIEKRVPSSIAIGEINSTSISTLSPGITISVPSGKVTTPVTSVVRK